LPDPLLPEEMPIQLAWLAALQAQPAAAVTATDEVPPALPTFWLDGEIANEHPASCVSVNVCAPAVIVPERDGPVLAVTAYWTDPLPLPGEPALTVNQLALLAAVQPHPPAVRTSK